MRVVLVTPTARSSAIGAISSRLALHLAINGHKVDVVGSETTASFGAPEHPFPSATIHYGESVVEEKLRHADSVIYQIGNNYSNHAGAVYWLHRMPGVVCLHDAFLGHLFSAWAQENWARAQSVLARWYGPEVQRDYWDWQARSDFLESTIERAPMTEWICSAATGIFTHSNYYVNRAVSACSGPVWSFPLCHAKDTSAVVDLVSARQLRVPDRYVVVTFGHIIPNKRVDLIIDAIGTDPKLKQTVDYRVVGPITPSYRHALERQAHHKGVSFTLTGEVSDAQLAVEISDADAVVALRWPAAEIASASVIESLWYGKPTIVTNTGWYSELPDDIVYKTHSNIESEQLSKILMSVLHSSNKLAKVDKITNYSRVTFNSETYCAYVLQFIVQNYKIFLVQNEIRRILSSLTRWRGIVSDAHLADRWNIV